MNLLPVQQAAQLSATSPQARWLIHGLWSEQAVGILGGEPKCGKSFLALDIALSVASGTACLRQFPVLRPGPVLLFPAEDSLGLVRQRLDGLCAATHLALAALPLHVITAPVLRLDLPADRQRLSLTIQQLQPRLLILDPLIRLHQADENDASQIAPLLGYLRQLQRRFALAVLVVHHAKKDAHAQRPGQALRGTSEFHGWGDSNLYLRRQRDQLTLSTEHRAAPPADPIPLHLVPSGPAAVLTLLSPAPGPVAPPASSALERVRQTLAAASQPLGLQELRKLCGIRTQNLCTALAQLSGQGLVQRLPKGRYQLAPNPPDQTPCQLALSIEPAGNGNGKR
jgi:hypothetical protein